MTRQLKNTIDPARPVELEDGTPCTIQKIEGDKVHVQFTGDHRHGSTNRRLETFFYYISTGHLGDSNGGKIYKRLRNVGGRVRPYNQWNLRKSPNIAPLKYNSTYFPKWTSHGGYCCGISHIKDFHLEPSKPARGGYVPNTFDKRHTGLEQFKLAIRDIRNNRAAGMIEAVLLDSQVAKWETVLLDNGFKKVGAFINSNTSHRLTVYHYYYGIANEPKTIIKAAVANPFKN